MDLRQSEINNILVFSLFKLNTESSYVQAVGYNIK